MRCTNWRSEAGWWRHKKTRTLRCGFFTSLSGKPLKRGHADKSDVGDNAVVDSDVSQRNASQGDNGCFRGSSYVARSVNGGRGISVLYAFHYNLNASRALYQEELQLVAVSSADGALGEARAQNDRVARTEAVNGQVVCTGSFIGEVEDVRFCVRSYSAGSDIVEGNLGGVFGAEVGQCFLGVSYSLFQRVELVNNGLNGGYFLVSGFGICQLLVSSNLSGFCVDVVLTFATNSNSVAIDGLQVSSGIAQCNIGLSGSQLQITCFNDVSAVSRNLVQLGDQRCTQQWVRSGVCQEAKDISSSGEWLASSSAQISVINRGTIGFQSSVQTGSSSSGSSSVGFNGSISGSFACNSAVVGCNCDSTVRLSSSSSFGGGGSSSSVSSFSGQNASRLSVNVGAVSLSETQGSICFSRSHYAVFDGVERRVAGSNFFLVGSNGSFSSNHSVDQAQAWNAAWQSASVDQVQSVLYGSWIAGYAGENLSASFWIVGRTNSVRLSPKIFEPSSGTA